ncbi:16S rRNA (cytosine(1402)-N(4))-methyltransferase RsmH [bacterium]|nr:16S rRNA (cytosine(1402)-N(4))-methyltransferase RsmH [bacterium]
MIETITHLPVLQKEVIKYLDPQPNENFIDATLGEGGHALAILEKTKPNGKVLGIEIDPEIYRKAKNKLSIINDQLSNRLILVNDSYTNLEKIIKEQNFKPIHGILFDLGMCSWHLEESGRGFSFKKDEFLDMRYNPNTQTVTAYEIVNRFPQPEIEKILKEFGEEKFARQIARQIVVAREKKPIKTTFDLVEVIKASVPLWYKRRRIHFATKTFQALRIAVNQELENIKCVLVQSMQVLEAGARIVIISFHSLEDRIIKHFFKQKAEEGKVQILTKKPITPTKEEIINNPRSRSAKLRAVQLIKTKR